MSKEILMNLFNQEVRAAREILLSLWDPIGVNGESQAQDEYDDYATEIVKRIDSGCAAADLSKYLEEIEVHELGLRPNSERAAAVGSALYQKIISVKEREG